MSRSTPICQLKCSQCHAKATPEQRYGNSARTHLGEELEKGKSIEVSGEKWAKAFGPNDECVQLGGMAFTVNISARLVAEQINVNRDTLRQQIAELEKGKENIRAGWLDCVKSRDTLRQQIADLQAVIESRQKHYEDRLAEATNNGARTIIVGLESRLTAQQQQIAEAEIRETNLLSQHHELEEDYRKQIAELEKMFNDERNAKLSSWKTVSTLAESNERMRAALRQFEGVGTPEMRALTDAALYTPAPTTEKV